VVNGKLKCADHIFLHHIPARRPVSDGYGFLFRLIFSFVHAPCTRKVDVALSFYALGLVCLDPPPLMVPISYARPKPLHNTRIRCPLFQLTAVNHYMSHPLYRVAPLYRTLLLLSLHPRCLVSYNSLWMTVCDFRVEKPILMTLPSYVVSSFGLALSYLTLFLCFLSLVSLSDITALQLLH